MFNVPFTAPLVSLSFSARRRLIARTLLFAEEPSVIVPFDPPLFPVPPELSL
jgi:hypothetical protein